MYSYLYESHLCPTLLVWVHAPTATVYYTLEDGRVKSCSVREDKKKPKVVYDNAGVYIIYLF